MASKSKQRGISFLVLLYIIGTLACVGLIAAQALPTYLEYTQAVKAIHKAKDAGNVLQIRNAYDKFADIDAITSIKAKDLEITKEGDTAVVSFTYDKEIHLFGPVFLVMKYAATTANSKAPAR